MATCYRDMGPCFLFAGVIWDFVSFLQGRGVFFWGQGSSTEAWSQENGSILSEEQATVGSLVIIVSEPRTGS